jgi:hypothetical protein
MDVTQSPTARSAPVLRLPAGPGQVGLLILELEGREAQRMKIVVKLDARLVHVVLALRSVMEADHNESWPARGWCGASTLCQMVEAQTQYPIGEKAVRNYVSQIRTRIAREIRGVADKLSNPLAPHLLIEGKRGLGFRLATDQLEVVLPMEFPRASLSG